MDIAKRLESLREEKEYTKEALAKALDIDEITVEDWESGKQSPSADSLIGLSKLYGMSLDELIYSGSKAPEYNEKQAVYSSRKVEEKRVIKKSTMEKSGKLSMILFPVLLMIVYVCLGVFMDLWHPGWIVLLAIPIYYALLILLNKLGDNVDEAVDDYITASEEEKKNSSK